MPAIVIQGKTYTLDDTERIFELIRGVTGCPVEEERRALYDICAMGPGEGRTLIQTTIRDSGGPGFIHHWPS